MNTNEINCIYDISSMRGSEIDEFVREADSRETSIEIMYAISQIALDYDDAVKIWESGEHLHHIVEIVTNNGMHDTTDFCWGVAGSDWAE